MLVIPGLVDAATSYEEAFARSQRTIRDEILPYAREKGVTLGIENVWHGFLLTPTEYVRYIDELDSPFVRAYLDVGNMIFGHPHHWVRSVGRRIAGVHMKDFQMTWDKRLFFSAPGQGSVDWRAVRRALAEVGYEGGVVMTGIPDGNLVAHFDRFARSRRRHFLPASAERMLGRLELRVHAAFLADLSRRFDWFARLAG